METQKIANLLSNADNEPLKFATRKWYVINDQNNTDYGDGDENSTTIKFGCTTKVIKSNLCGYSDAFILVTGDIITTGGDADTKVVFKNCAPFTKCVTHINDKHVDNTDNIDIVMPIYNLTEYSDNYSDTSERLWQFKRDEQNISNSNIPVGVNSTNSTSFEFKSSFFKTLENDDDGIFKNAMIAVPLKCLSSSWRPLELPLISCKIHLELIWSKNCVMSNIVEATSFKITNTKLYVQIVNLSSKDNAKLVKLLDLF